ncbi:MAG: hypothetical protein ISN28_14635 [Ectothiorhodospiraceae bacterium AqS1]|nr:hypothetical protein [Ectothiorhodospiraceae bacterium AqS1]
MRELSGIEKGWLGGGQGERVAGLALLRAGEFISKRADLADILRVFPTEDGGVSLEFDQGDWSFGIEIKPDGVVEIDGCSGDGVFEARSFDGLSKEFFEALDEVVSVAF